MRRYTLVLNFGYVESQRLSYMPWTSKRLFKDAKEALLDLAGFLKDQYLIENKKALKKCCDSTKQKDTSAKFCTKCGQNLDVLIDDEDFVNWLKELDTDIDQFHGHINWDPAHRWQSNGLEGTPNQRFVYQAEWVLAAAIGHPPSSDMTFEVICKNRTRKRSESFSYY